MWGKSAMIINDYYDHIIDITIKYFNTEYKGKISSSTIIMYLSSLIGLSCDRCKFYINDKVCCSTDKISKYISRSNTKVVITCMITTDNNINLNKIFKLFVDVNGEKKELNSDIRGKKIISVKGCYIKFEKNEKLLSTVFGTNLELHLSEIKGDKNDLAKEYIRKRLSSHIIIKVDNRDISFDYKWLTDSILAIQLINIGYYQISLKPIVLEHETRKLLSVLNLESYIYEEFEVLGL